MVQPSETLGIWLHHLEDEADAAFLYRELAQAERDARKADLYRRLAGVEDRHVGMWRKLLAEHGHDVEPPPPSRGARLRAWLARRVGAGILLPMLLSRAVARHGASLREETPLINTTTSLIALSLLTMLAFLVLLSILSNSGVALAMVRPPLPSLGSEPTQLTSAPGP